MLYVGISGGRNAGASSIEWTWNNAQMAAFAVETEGLSLISIFHAVFVDEYGDGGE